MWLFYGWDTKCMRKPTKFIFSPKYTFFIGIYCQTNNVAVQKIGGTVAVDKFQKVIAFGSLHNMHQITG